MSNVPERKSNAMDSLKTGYHKNMANQDRYRVSANPDIDDGSAPSHARLSFYQQNTTQTSPWDSTSDSHARRTMPVYQDPGRGKALSPSISSTTPISATKSATEEKNNSFLSLATPASSSTPTLRHNQRRYGEREVTHPPTTSAPIFSSPSAFTTSLSNSTSTLAPITPAKSTTSTLNSSSTSSTSTSSASSTTSTNSISSPYAEGNNSELSQTVSGEPLSSLSTIISPLGLRPQAMESIPSISSTPSSQLASPQGNTHGASIPTTAPRFYGIYVSPSAEHTKRLPIREDVSTDTRADSWKRTLLGGKYDVRLGLTPSEARAKVSREVVVYYQYKVEQEFGIRRVDPEANLVDLSPAMPLGVPHQAIPCFGSSFDWEAAWKRAALEDGLAEIVLARDANGSASDSSSITRIPGERTYLRPSQPIPVYVPTFPSTGLGEDNNDDHNNDKVDTKIDPDEIVDTVPYFASNLTISLRPIPPAFGSSNSTVEPISRLIEVREFNPRVSPIPEPTLAQLLHMQQILCLLSQRHPDLAFCPVLVATTRVFLSLMSPAESFLCIETILRRSLRNEFFFPVTQASFLRICVASEILLARAAPALCETMPLRLGIQPAALFAQWFGSLLTSLFPASTLYRLLDFFILEGLSGLVLVCVSFLNMYEDVLMRSSSQAHFLQNLLTLSRLDDADGLLKNARRLNVTRAVILETAKKVILPPTKVEADSSMDAGQGNWDILSSTNVSTTVATGTANTTSSNKSSDTSEDNNLFAELDSFQYGNSLEENYDNNEKDETKAWSNSFESEDEEGYIGLLRLFREQPVLEHIAANSKIPYPSPCPSPGYEEPHNAYLMTGLCGASIHNPTPEYLLSLQTLRCFQVPKPIYSTIFTATGGNLGSSSGAGFGMSANATTALSLLSKTSPTTKTGKSNSLLNMSMGIGMGMNGKSSQLSSSSTLSSSPSSPSAPLAPSHLVSRDPLNVAPKSILGLREFFILSHWLGVKYRVSPPRLLFSTAVHGYTLERLLQNTSGRSHFLIVKHAHGVLGCFVESWAPSDGLFLNSKAFAFQLFPTVEYYPFQTGLLTTMNDFVEAYKKRRDREETLGLGRGVDARESIGVGINTNMGIVPRVHRSSHLENKNKTKTGLRRSGVGSQETSADLHQTSMIDTERRKRSIQQRQAQAQLEAHDLRRRQHAQAQGQGQGQGQGQEQTVKSSKSGSGSGSVSSSSASSSSSSKPSFFASLFGFGHSTSSTPTSSVTPSTSTSTSGSPLITGSKKSSVPGASSPAPSMRLRAESTASTSSREEHDVSSEFPEGDVGGFLEGGGEGIDTTGFATGFESTLHNARNMLSDLNALRQAQHDKQIKSGTHHRTNNTFPLVGNVVFSTVFESDDEDMDERDGQSGGDGHSEEHDQDLLQMIMEEFQEDEENEEDEEDGEIDKEGENLSNLLHTRTPTFHLNTLISPQVSRGSGGISTKPKGQISKLQVLDSASLSSEKPSTKLPVTSDVVLFRTLYTQLTRIHNPRNARVFAGCENDSLYVRYMKLLSSRALTLPDTVVLPVYKTLRPAPSLLFQVALRAQIPGFDGRSGACRFPQFYLDRGAVGLANPFAQFAVNPLQRLNLYIDTVPYGASARELMTTASVIPSISTQQFQLQPQMQSHSQSQSQQQQPQSTLKSALRSSYNLAGSKAVSSRVTTMNANGQNRPRPQSKASLSLLDGESEGSYEDLSKPTTLRPKSSSGEDDQVTSFVSPGDKYLHNSHFDQTVDMMPPKQNLPGADAVSFSRHSVSPLASMIPSNTSRVLFPIRRGDFYCLSQNGSLDELGSHIPSAITAGSDYVDGQSKYASPTSTSTSIDSTNTITSNHTSRSTGNGDKGNVENTMPLLRFFSNISILSFFEAEAAEQAPASIQAFIRSHGTSSYVNSVSRSRAVAAAAAAAVAVATVPKPSEQGRERGHSVSIGGLGGLFSTPATTQPSLSSLFTTPGIGEGSSGSVSVTSTGATGPTGPTPLAVPAAMSMSTPHSASIPPAMPESGRVPAGRPVHTLRAFYSPTHEDYNYDVDVSRNAYLSMTDDVGRYLSMTNEQFLRSIGINAMAISGSPEATDTTSSATFASRVLPLYVIPSYCPLVQLERFRSKILPIPFRANSVVAQVVSRLTDSIDMISAKCANNHALLETLESFTHFIGGSGRLVGRLAGFSRQTSLASPLNRTVSSTGNMGGVGGGNGRSGRSTTSPTSSTSVSSAGSVFDMAFTDNTSTGSGGGSSFDVRSLIFLGKRVQSSPLDKLTLKNAMYALTHNYLSRRGILLRGLYFSATSPWLRFGAFQLVLLRARFALARAKVKAEKVEKAKKAEEVEKTDETVPKVNSNENEKTKKSATPSSSCIHTPITPIDVQIDPVSLSTVNRLAPSSSLQPPMPPVQLRMTSSLLHAIGYFGMGYSFSTVAQTKTYPSDWIYTSSHLLLTIQHAFSLHRNADTTATSVTPATPTATTATTTIATTTTTTTTTTTMDTPFRALLTKTNNPFLQDAGLIRAVMEVDISPLLLRHAETRPCCYVSKSDYTHHAFRAMLSHATEMTVVLATGKKVSDTGFSELITALQYDACVRYFTKPGRSVVLESDVGKTSKPDTNSTVMLEKEIEQCIIRATPGSSFPSSIFDEIRTVGVIQATDICHIFPDRFVQLLASSEQFILDNGLSTLPSLSLPLPTSPSSKITLGSVVSILSPLRPVLLLTNDRGIPISSLNIDELFEIILNALALEAGVSFSDHKPMEVFPQFTSVAEADFVRTTQTDMEHLSSKLSAIYASHDAKITPSAVNVEGINGNLGKSSDRGDEHKNDASASLSNASKSPTTSPNTSINTLASAAPTTIPWTNPDIEAEKARAAEEKEKKALLSPLRALMVCNGKEIGIGDSTGMALLVDKFLQYGYSQPTTVFANPSLALTDDPVGRFQIQAIECWGFDSL